MDVGVAGRDDRLIFCLISEVYEQMLTGRCGHGRGRAGGGHLGCCTSSGCCGFCHAWRDEGLET